MFVILLKFGENKRAAGQWMEAHNAWIRVGLEEGAFLLVGSIQPKAGGFLLAKAPSREELEARVHRDPFVAHRVVTAEILEIQAAKAQPELAFLLPSPT